MMMSHYAEVKFQNVCHLGLTLNFFMLFESWFLKVDLMNSMPFFHGWKHAKKCRNMVIIIRNNCLTS